MNKERNLKKTHLKLNEKIFGFDMTCLNCDSFCHEKNTDHGECYIYGDNVNIISICNSFHPKENFS